MKQIIRHHFLKLSSTQDWAKTHATAIPADRWLLITTDQQTKGRAVRDAIWLSPPDVNIYATFALRFPVIKSQLLIHLPQITALAICQTLEGFAIQPKIKWINDVLINHKKVAGVLCESQPLNQTQLAVFIGIGLNVNMSKSACDKIDQPATSLLIETNRYHDKEIILHSIGNNLQHVIQILLNEGFAPLQMEINKFCIYNDNE